MKSNDVRTVPFWPPFVPWAHPWYARLSCSPLIKPPLLPSLYSHRSPNLVPRVSPLPPWERDCRSPSHHSWSPHCSHSLWPPLSPQSTYLVEFHCHFILLLIVLIRIGKFLSVNGSQGYLPHSVDP